MEDDEEMQFNPRMAALHYAGTIPANSEDFKRVNAVVCALVYIGDTMRDINSSLKAIERQLRAK